jgi:hypothetical protein
LWYSIWFHFIEFCVLCANPFTERGEHAEALYEELRASNPDKLSIPVAMLKNLKTAWEKSPYPIMGELTQPVGDAVTLNHISGVASTIIDLVDQNSLLAHYGMKADLNPDAAKVKT